MSTLELFTAIQSSQFAVTVGHQNHLFGAVAQLTHITGLILVLSSVLLVSLRLFGFGITSLTTAQLAATTSRLVWIGLALLVISGYLIFAPAAVHYYPNDIFWFKLFLLVSAVFIHVTLYRKVTQAEAPHALTAKATAVISLSLWFGVAFAGRFVGFF
jgi:hypothetical protein